VLERVRQLSDCGYTVLLSTHNPQHALTFSDRVLALCAGEVAALGPAQDVLTPVLMKQLYGVGVEVISTERGLFLLPEREGVST